MSFVDFNFYPVVLILLLLLLFLQAILKKRSSLHNTLKKAILLVFSLWVAGLYDIRFSICLAAVSVITYVSALIIGNAQDGKRGMVTGISVGILIAVLCYFKYVNFLMDSVFAAVGKNWNALSIILPIGISFYIFSAVSYVLDVNWGGIQADKSFPDVALFLSFFPKIVCGPVVRAGDFLPQLKENRRITWAGLSEGVQILVFGLFKKMVLADHIAVFVGDVFYAPAAYSTGTVWLAVFSNLLYLYFDFSGYSDMAVGMSRMLGYEIKRNFNLPFVAANISEFWDRWHMSLSSWLNDYVFNPVALSFRRKMADQPKAVRKKYKLLPECAALAVTFLVSGIWHGAGWTFVIWGCLHGILSVAHRMYASRIKKKRKHFAEHKPRWVKAADVVLCYATVNIIQVFFRADSVGDALLFYKEMFTVHTGIAQPYTWTFFGYAVLIAGTALAYRKSRREGLRSVEGYYPVQDLSTVKGMTLFLVLCGLTVIMGYYGETFFVYGQF